MARAWARCRVRWMTWGSEAQGAVWVQWLPPRQVGLFRELGSNKRELGALALAHKSASAVRCYHGEDTVATQPSGVHRCLLHSYPFAALHGIDPDLCHARGASHAGRHGRKSSPHPCAWRLSKRRAVASTSRAPGTATVTTSTPRRPSLALDLTCGGIAARAKRRPAHAALQEGKGFWRGHNLGGGSCLGKVCLGESLCRCGIGDDAMRSMAGVVARGALVVALQVGGAGVVGS
eukprot:scaffold1781_cov416-Prasinococcus_capsulatus_cf.AAC.5